MIAEPNGSWIVLGPDREVSEIVEPGRSLQSYAFPALLLGGVAVGCAPILVRLSEVGPSVTAFWRVSLALPLLGVMAALAHGRAGSSATPRTTREWLTASAPGVFLGFELLAWHDSLHRTSVANATSPPFSTPAIS